MNNPFKFINRIRKKKVNFFPIFFISLSIIVSMNLYADQNFDWTSIKHQVKFEHLTTKHGLSQSSVLCIVHDSRGFMWFGTEDGLNMYDGYEFKIFRPEPENPYSITNNRIFALHEDREGILWIGTNGGGLNKFDHKTGRFYAYRESGSSGSISADNISTIYEDRKGNLWFGTIDMGLNKLPQKEKHKDYPFFISYIHDPGDPNSLSNNHITSVYEDHRDTLWIGTEGGGLNRLVPGKYKHSSPTFISYKTGIYPVVTSICEDQKKNLWIGTKNGLYRFNRKIKKFSHYPANPRDPRSLSHNYITKMLDLYRWWWTQ